MAVCRERLGMSWSTYLLTCFGRLYTKYGDQFAVAVSGLTGGTPITPSDIEGLVNAGCIGPVTRLHIYDKRYRYFSVYEKGKRTYVYSVQKIPAGIFGDPSGLVLQYAHHQTTFTRFTVRQWTLLRLEYAGRKASTGQGVMDCSRFASRHSRICHHMVVSTLAKKASAGQG